MKMPPTVANKQSELLNTDENLQVFKLLGNRCETMATTVVQLYITQPPTHSNWILRNTGVLCFVKDSSQKSYFFRLYCLRTNQMLWQHEIYNNMEYKELKAYLHCFEGDQCIVGFNFANNNEAYQFFQVVKSKIEMRKRREERKSRTISQSSFPQPLSNNNNLASPKMPNFSVDPNNMFKKNSDAILGKKKKNVKKEDIGIPTNFQHISHIGWNADTGFDINTEDENLKRFFDKAGVSATQLEDPQIKEFIYGFVEKHQESIIGPKNGVRPDNVPPPVVPPRGPVQRTTSRAAPPPPPVGGPPRIERTPSRPHQEAPKKPRPPSPPKSAPPGHVPNSAAPPPPPPPLPPPMDFVVSPPSTGANGPPTIQLGAMDPSSLRPAPPMAPPMENPRNNLLQQIQKGISLKPVDQREIKAPSSPSPGKEASNPSDLADVLRDRLKEFLDKRSQAMNLSDTSDTDSNDNEWDE